MSARMFVITGGPGSGKSSVVAALAGDGIRCMPEAGRAIIQDQVAIGGHALPWSDRKAFAELMLAWDLRSYREAAAANAPAIFDRGIPDVAGYLTWCGLAVPDHVRKAAEVFRYHRTAFIAPHWPAIYAQDAERKQSAAEAEATCRTMAEIYTALGYELVPLPLVGVDERARFVRAYMQTV